MSKRRMLIADVSYEVLAQLLQLPEGQKIIAAECSFDNNLVLLKIEGEATQVDVPMNYPGMHVQHVVPHLGPEFIDAYRVHLL